jgi:hypothetical protein
MVRSIIRQCTPRRPFAALLLAVLVVSLPPRNGSAEPPAPATNDSTQEEEVVDFAAEEAASDADSQARDGGGAHGGHLGAAAGGLPGFKIILDLLLQYSMPLKRWDFLPHHTNVIIEVAPMPNLTVALDVSPLPLFYEVQWSPHPRLTLRGGKILIPFGSNAFHHLIGGRIDEHSEFLPQLWADYGLGLNHRLYDGERLYVEYDLYVVNGFSGVDVPDTTITSAPDTNAWKGAGGRVKASIFGHYDLIGSIYYDRWDPKQHEGLLYYSAAAQLGEGFIPLPVLRRLRLRGEWARGEIQLEHANYQAGILWHAVGRAGFYAEAQLGILEDFAARLRVGQLNPDDTVSNTRDIFLVEPAVIIGSSRLSVALAYQMCFNPNAATAYDPKVPGDIFYLKFFLQY